MTKTQARLLTSAQLRERLNDRASLLPREVIWVTAVLEERRDHGRPTYAR